MKVTGYNPTTQTVQTDSGSDIPLSHLKPTARARVLAKYGITPEPEPQKKSLLREAIAFLDRSDKAKYAIVWIFLGAFALSFFAIIADDPKPKQETLETIGPQDTGADKCDALTEAKKLVRLSLQYPDDASFPMFEQSADRAGDSWRVFGKVKAKNAFGAELTYTYLCFLDDDLDCQFLRVGENIVINW